MTGNIWIDLQMSLAEIEAEISDIPDELPRIPTVGNAMGQRGLKGSDRRCTQPQPHVWPSARCLVGGHEAGSPMQVFVSPDDDRRTGGCAPLTPGVRKPVAASTDSGEATKQR
jgi:hypothetical protein